MDNAYATNKRKMKHCLTARYHWGDENGKSNAKFSCFALPDEAKKAGYTEVYLEPLDRK